MTTNTEEKLRDELAYLRVKEDDAVEAGDRDLAQLYVAGQNVVLAELQKIKGDTPCS